MLNFAYFPKDEHTIKYQMDRDSLEVLLFIHAVYS